MAPASEYATTGGGKLKIKGVQGGRVDKKKKKKKKREKDGAKEKPKEEEEKTSAENQKGGQAEKSRSGSRDLSEEREEEGGTYGKTEAERRYNEARRKRVRFFSTTGVSRFDVPDDETDI